MRIDTAGAQPVLPDFDVLRAGLTLAQHGTPTVSANAEARLSRDPLEALVRVFGEGVPAGELLQALGGSFDPRLADRTSGPGRKA